MHEIIEKVYIYIYIYIYLIIQIPVAFSINLIKFNAFVNNPVISFGCSVTGQADP
jgi:hypothetical protein